MWIVLGYSKRVKGTGNVIRPFEVKDEAVRHRNFLERESTDPDQVYVVVSEMEHHYGTYQDRNFDVV